MSKMTDKDIIQALKHCYEHKSCNDCVGCLGAEECILNVDPAGDIYPIINRQQAEIERLKEEARTVDKDLEELDRPLTELRAEAIKEFAEKLKKQFKEDINDIQDSITRITDPDAIDGQYETISAFELSLDYIDNLVKELVGEGK